MTLNEESVLGGRPLSAGGGAAEAGVCLHWCSAAGAWPDKC